MTKKGQREKISVTAKKITGKNFKQYGWIIEPGGFKQSPKENQFKIVVNEKKSAGWRIAYLIVRDKYLDRLEQHPRSMESFEPLKGRALLYVSPQKAPEKIECFMLDKPIILKKGVWHGVICCRNSAHIKITENSRVKLVFHDPGFRLAK